MKRFIKSILLAIISIGSMAEANDLTFWSWRQEDRAFYEKIFSQFQKTHPTISVKFSAFEAPNYQETLFSSLEKGKGPDVIHVRAYYQIEGLAAKGYLYPLSIAEVPNLANFSTASLDSLTSHKDHNLYGVPFATQTFLILYNADVFTKFELSPPETWSGFMELCETLKKHEVTPLANGIATPWQTETLFGGLLASHIGRQFEAELHLSRTTFNDHRFTEALAKLNDITQYLPTNYSQVTYSDAQELFTSGQAAMFVGGSYDIAPLRRANSDLKIAIFASPPQNQGDERLVATIPDGGFAINSQTSNLEDSLTLLRFLSSIEFAQPFTDELLNVSPVPGVVIKDPVLKQISTFNENSISYFSFVHFNVRNPQRSEALRKGIWRMLGEKNVTPEQIGQEMTAEMIQGMQNRPN